MLNISPESDGTASQKQPEALLSISKWLEVKGSGIYGTLAPEKTGEARLRFTKKRKCTLHNCSTMANSTGTN